MSSPSDDSSDLSDAEGSTNLLPPAPAQSAPRTAASEIVVRSAAKIAHALAEPPPGYVVLQTLGQGAMGVVYRARQLRPRRDVALKMLVPWCNADEELRARLLREAEAIARLRHPGIVQVYEVGEASSGPYFAMELVEGTSLSNRLKAENSDREESVRLVESLARALHHAHCAGIVHRDVKPANVLIDRQGVAKLADFGLASCDTDFAARTADGMTLGTPAYMSPEQAAGRSRVADGRADVWALGVMLYEMLCGERPFKGSTTEVLRAIEQVDPPAPGRVRRGVPRDLEKICLKCLEKDPGRRYATAEDLAEDLRRFRESKPVLARPLGAPGRAVRWIKRNPLGTAGLSGMGACMLALFLTAVYYDAFVRKHVAYFEGLTYRWGVPQGIGELGMDQVSKRALSYEITRFGRWNQPVSLRVVDESTREPTDSPLVSWFDGYFGAERLLIWTRNEYEYDPAGRLLRERGFSPDGMPIYTLQYSTTSADRRGRPVRATARYVQDEGFDLSLPTDVRVVQIERDAAGFDRVARFFDGEGRPQRNADGVYGYRIAVGRTGQPTSIVGLASDGQTPLLNVHGFAEARIAYDEGREVNCWYLDATGRRTHCRDGYAQILSQYDSFGNLERLRFYGVDGEPATHQRFSTTTVEFTREGQSEQQSGRNARGDSDGAGTADAG